MTKANDQLAARLEQLITELAASDAPELLAEARANARQRARALIEEALTEQLLEHAAGSAGGARAKPRAEKRASKASAAPAPAPAPAEVTGTGLYVYAVVSADDHRLPEGLEGMDPAADVVCLRSGPLAAVMTPVALAEFGEEALTENLNRMEWLERAARGHERVLEQLLGRTALVPLRMCTVFREEASVRAMLADRQHELLDALRRLGDATEWGVKALFDRSTLVVAEEPEAESEPSLGEGARYLAGRRHDRRRADQADRQISGAVGEAHARLSEEAREATVHPPQSRELAGHSGDMVLNASYLVDDDHAHAFGTLVRELDARHRETGLSFELTGPWPPYNFVAAAAAGSTADAPPR